MKKTQERRKEQRMHYELPVKFAENPDTAVSQGIMVDISSRGMAFICNTNDNCPYQGQKLTTHFSIPRFGRDSSDSHNLTRTGRVYRIDTINESQHRIAMQFDEPPFWDMPPRLNT
jgi:tricorn protease-like protein